MNTLMRAATALATIVVLCNLGCGVRSSPLVTKADFGNVTNGMFDPASYDMMGGGSSEGGDDLEFTSIYIPKDPDAELHFDFTPWDKFLKKKETFTSYGKGGSPGLYWRQTWSNRNRHIVIDAVAIKDGSVLVTYCEILR